MKRILLCLCLLVGYGMADYLEAHNEALRQEFVTNDISVLKVYGDPWACFKSGINSAKYNIVMPMVQSLGFIGMTVGELAIGKGWAWGESSFDKRKEIYKKQQAMNARIAQLGGAASHFLSYQDMLDMKGTGDGIPISSILEKCLLDIIQFLPTLGLLLAIGFIILKVWECITSKIKRLL